MSSLKDLASLIMIPSLYKDGRLDTVKPLGNSIIHPDATGNNDGTDGSTPAEGNFTFSRGSNLAATRVDVNGLIEKGRENLLLQSNQFDTTWTLASQMLTPVGGQSGYDGTNDAWKIQRSDTSGRFIRQNISQSGVQTFSVYAKKGNVDYISLVSVGSNVTKAIFSLPTDGSGVNTYLDSDNISAKISYISNGWYRVEAVYSDTITDVRIYPSETATAEAGVIADAFVYIQDAQLEAGLVATDYIETGASTAQAGILEDMPRLDYSGSCPALLLEPQRSNLIPHSEYLNGWLTISAITLEANTDETLSPEGKYNAYKTTAIGGGTQRIFQSLSGVSAGSLTMSMYVKSGTENEIRLLTTSGVFDITFNLSNQTKQENVGTGTIEAVGNGWYRISATGTSAGGSEVPQVRHLGNAGSSEYQYWYGIQIEEGSYPTSYIPTYGSSVTRSYDNSSLGGLQTSSILNGTKGTLLFEGIKKQDWYFSNFVITTDGSNTNRSLLIDNSGSVIRLRVWNASSSIDATIFTTSLSNGTFKYLIRWDNGNLAVFVNGASVGSATINAYSYTTINLKEGTFSNNLVNQVLTFPTALTDNECIALTTI